MRLMSLFNWGERSRERDQGETFDTGILAVHFQMSIRKINETHFLKPNRAFLMALTALLDKTLHQPYYYR